MRIDIKHFCKENTATEKNGCISKQLSAEIKAIIKEITPVIYRNDDLREASLMNAIDSKVMTLLDAYIYCSRKFKQISLKSEIGNSCKQKIFAMKIAMLEKMRNKNGFINDDTVFILFEDPHKIE